MSLLNRRPTLLGAAWRLECRGDPQGQTPGGVDNPLGAG